MALRNQPYIPLYVNDFMSDEKLAECSAAATGVYIRIMCLMHKSEHYGKILLKQNDKLSSNQVLNFASKIARHIPYDKETTYTALSELLENKVLIIEDDVIIQKRMVKDSELSSKRAETGAKGGKKTQSKNKNFGKAKKEANTEIEIVIENEDSINTSKVEIKGKSPTISEWTKIENFKGKFDKSELFEKVGDYLELSPDQMQEWIYKFVKYKSASTSPNGPLNDLIEHFKNWTYTKLSTNQNPKSQSYERGEISTGAGDVSKDYSRVPDEYKHIGDN